MNSPDMIVISGAGTGIGRAAARRLVADGFHVLAVGRRPDPLERLAKELAPHLDTVSADLATVAGGQFLGKPLERVGAPSHREHMKAVCDQPAGCRPANAGARTTDHDHVRRVHARSPRLAGPAR